jgi:hypothetical protein
MSSRYIRQPLKRIYHTLWIGQKTPAQATDLSKLKMAKAMVPSAKPEPLVQLDFNSPVFQSIFSNNLLYSYIKYKRPYASD